MRTRCVVLVMAALLLGVVPGMGRAADSYTPEDAQREMSRLRDLHMDRSLLVPHIPDLPESASFLEPFEIQPGTTATFSDPDPRFLVNDDCSHSGLVNCSAHWDPAANDGNGAFSLWVLTGAFGWGAANGQMHTTEFRVPGQDGQQYTATISATAYYSGGLIALAAIGGSARANLTITASLMKGTELVQLKEVLNSECLAIAAGLSGAECSKSVDDYGTADFQASLEANQTYSVVIRATAFARAMLASAAEADFDTNWLDRGVSMQQVTVSVEQDVGDLIEQTRQEVAQIGQELSVVKANTVQALTLNTQQIDQLDASLGLDNQQIERLVALDSMMQTEQGRSERILTEADDVWTTRIESSLLRAEPLLGLYLPGDEGGLLERVRDLVGQRILQAEAIGQDVAPARALLSQAEAAILRGQFRQAFALLSGAYKTLTTNQVAIPAGGMP